MHDSANARLAVAGGLVHAVTIAPLSLMPFFVGALQDLSGVPPKLAPPLAMIEPLTLALFSFAIAIFRPNLTIPRAAIGGLSLSGSAGFAGWLLGPDLKHLLACRVFASFGVALSALALHRSVACQSQPRRVYGVIAMTAIAEVAVVATITPWAIDELGLGALSLIPCLMSLIALTVVIGLWNVNHFAPAAAFTRPYASRAALLPLGTIVLFALGSGAVWVFSERVARSAGLSATMTGVVFGVANVVSMLASLGVAFIGPRMSNRQPAIAGLAVTALSLIGIATAKSSWMAAMGIFLYLQAGSFVYPILLALILDYDGTGTAAAATPGLYLVSVSGGGAIGGTLRSLYGLPLVGIVGAGCCLTAAALVWFSHSSREMPEAVGDYGRYGTKK